MAFGLCIAQGHDLGVGLARALRVAAAQHLTVRTHDDATHAWVGRGEVKRVMCQAQGLLHESGVLRGETHAAIMDGRVSDLTAPTLRCSLAGALHAAHPEMIDRQSAAGVGCLWAQRRRAEGVTLDGAGDGHFVSLPLYL